MPEKTVLRIMNSVAAALECMHSKGISHRDVKLENVLVSNSDELKLCDFGSSTNEVQIIRRRLLGTLTTRIGQTSRTSLRKRPPRSIGAPNSWTCTQAMRSGPRSTSLLLESSPSSSASKSSPSNPGFPQSTSSIFWRTTIPTAPPSSNSSTIASALTRGIAPPRQRSGTALES